MPTFKSEASLNLSELKEIGVQIEHQARLANYTTFRLGGFCPCLLKCSTPSQLQSSVKKLASHKIPFIVIGSGSNLVVSDLGLECFVIRYVSDEPIIERKGNDLVVSGSTNLDSFVQFAVDQGLEGITYCSGIPGTIAGAVVGNAGAFGKQVGDVLVSVTAMDSKGNVHEIKNKDLGFKYRDSLLKASGDIVLSVRFHFNLSDKEKLKQERNEILEIRHEKHPDLRTHPCAGSFFRNIEPTSSAGKRQATGWFLEQVGGKNLRHGGAVIFDKHANIIVKGDNCSAGDVYHLSQKMHDLVMKEFNLNIEREVRFVGRFEGVPASENQIVW